MSIQKYQINDRVKRPNKNNCFTDPRKRNQLLEEHNIIKCRYGTIIDVELKKIRGNRTAYYYSVKWDDSRDIAIHGSNTLKPAEEV
tara:strand:+ start:252 stop:509 length:258 start_codon:yes stop_codon:yes gene_type:complete